MDENWTLGSLAREVQRLESRLTAKVSTTLHRAEIDNLKDDVKTLEAKLDKIIESQIMTARTAVWQLIAIIVTMVVAGFGAFS